MGEITACVNPVHPEARYSVAARIIPEARHGFVVPCGSESAYLRFPPKTPSRGLPLDEWPMMAMFLSPQPITYCYACNW